MSGTNDVVERFAGRRRAVLLAAGGCALAIALAGRGEPSVALGVPAHDAPSYTLMQMNVCLSGFAGCFGRVAYPAGVDDAAARIRAARPDAVTVNEACHGDVARIARKTGYHLRFSTVRTAAGPLRCVRPGGRGRFGDAVLTRAPVVASDSHAFAAQAGSERRRWLCVTTSAGGRRVHRAPRDPLARRGRGERGAVRGARDDPRAARWPRAPSSSAATSTAAAPAPRPASGPAPTTPPARPRASSTSTAARVLRSPAAHVVPAMYTDHDVLVIRARAV